MKQMLKYILSVVMESMRIAENKHGIILALNSGLIVITVGFFSSNILSVILLNLLVIIMCSISIIFCFLGLFARDISYRRQKHSLKNLNLLYFKDISNFAEKDYLNCIIKAYDFPKDYEPDNFELDLARQIVVNSKIATKKYKFFNQSVIFLVAGLVINIFLMSIVGFGG